MAFATSGVFGALIEDALENTIALDLSDTGAGVYKAALFNNTTVPDEDAASAATQYGAGGTWTTTNEVDDPTDWATGGEPLTSVTSTRAAGVYKFDAADTPQNGTNTTLADVYGSMVYDDSATTPVVDQGVCYNDFGGVQAVTAGDFTIQWHVNGIMTITFTEA